jgi:phosphoglycolate phosphatase-like HAD superfamily hydrolase
LGFLIQRILDEPLHGDQILVIGDTPHDIQCGRAIGARVLAVATGTNSIAELKSNRPDWAIENLGAIRATDLCA